MLKKYINPTWGFLFTNFDKYIILSRYINYIKQMKKVIIIIVIILACAGLGVYLYLQDVKNGVDTNGGFAAVGQVFPMEGKEHVPDGTHVVYKTNPPTSGDHYATPAKWGVYEQTLLDEQLVHN